MSRARARVALALTLVVASAEGADPQPARAPTERAPSSAMGRVASELAAGLGEVPRGALVVASKVESDVVVSRGDELAAKLAALVAGRLTAARAHPHPLSLGAARAHLGGAPALVYLTGRIERGQLRVAADLFVVAENSWERLKAPAPAPRAHAFAHAAVDAELRAHLPVVPLEQASVRRATHDLGSVLALACGDADGDGGNELVLVTRERVVRARARGAGLVADRSAPWSALAPPLAVPLREPWGTAVVAAPSIHVGHSSYGAVELDADLSVKRRAPGLPLGDAARIVCAPLVPRANALGARLAACGATTPDAATDGAAVDVLATMTSIARDGSTSIVTATREPQGDLLVAREGRSPASITLADVGATVALADWDQDGIPEIATSSLADDAIVVQSWSDAKLKRRATYAAPAGVRALAFCPPEAGARPALVAAVGDREVWLVR